MMSDDGPVPVPATYFSGQQVLMLPYYAMHIIDAVLCIECSICQMSLSSITHCSCASRPPKQTSMAEDTPSHLNALTHPPPQSSSCSATSHTVTTLHGISPIPLCWWKISNSRLLCSLTQGVSPCYWGKLQTLFYTQPLHWRNQALPPLIQDLGASTATALSKTHRCQMHA